MSNDKWVKRWEVEGSSGNTYVVAIDDDGNYGCSCPVWKFRRLECKHILQVKANGGQECGQIVYRDASPGNVGEVTIKGDQVLYPLVPIGGSADLPATIVYDLQRAGVEPKQVKDYQVRMFPGVSFKRIKAHVETRGRLVYSEFVDGEGWVKPVHVSHTTALGSI